MRNSKTLLALTVLSLSAAGAAQTVVPPSATTQLGGSVSGFPFSYTAYVRYQQAIDPSYGKIGLIHGISFRSRSTVANLAERQWQEMRVILSDLPFGSVSQMSGTFASNLSANQLEVFRGRFNIYRPNPSDPLEFAVTIPFEKPFLYTATKPLVVDLMPSGAGYEGFPNCGSGGNGTVMDYSRDSGLYNALGKGTCAAPPTGARSASVGGFVMQLYYAPMLMPFGKGCAGSNGKIPQIGSTGSAALGSNFSFTMRDAPNNSNSAVLVIGLSNTVDTGSRLPLDLSAATPAQRCWQNSEALLVFFLPVAAGASALPVTIPNNPAIKGLEVFSQFAVDDPTLGGFTVTQGGVIRPQ